MDEKKFDEVLKKIGNTPLVDTGIDRVYAKIEAKNPAGSIKDRAALFMLKRGYQEGKLTDKGIVEATSGNTGIGLAYIARELGIKSIIVMPESMSIERRTMIASYGAELVLTPKEEGMAGAVKKARELEAEGYYFVSQFENEGNVDAHYFTTAPEVFTAMPDVKWIVAGIGSGGTVMGFKKYIEENGLNCKVCGIEPLSSPLLTKGKAGAHKIQGIGANFIPKLIEKSKIDLILPMSDNDAFDYVKWFYKSKKIKVGISSGAVLAAAELLSEKVSGKIVAILADGGDRYPESIYK